ncbi:unnamed protein product, partial [Polarella glacialis]
GQQPCAGTRMRRAVGQGGRGWALALSVLREEMQPSLAAFNAALHVCAEGHRWRPCLDLLAEMLNNNNNNNDSNKNNNNERLESRKGAPRPDQVSFNTAISSCGRAQHWAHSLDLLSRMRHAQLAPDVVSFNASASALVAGAQWQRALGLLPELSRLGLRPSAVSFGTMAAACEKGSSWEGALQLHLDQRRHRLDPSLILYNSTISAMGRAQEWQRSLAALSELREAGLCPSTVTFNASISACARGRYWQGSLGLLAEMLAKSRTAGKHLPAAGASPNAISFSTTMLACMREGSWELALGLLDDMSAVSVELDLTGYGRLLVEAEQRSHGGREAFLLQRLGAGRWAAAAEEAAALLLQLPWPPKPSSSRLGAVTARLWQACGGTGRAQYEGSVGQSGWEGDVSRAELQDAGQQRAAHAKELRLLQHVLRNATPGDAASVCEAAESFAEVLEPWGRWLKVAAGAKAEFLVAAAQGASKKGALLEIGGYCGYSAIRLAAALPGRRIVSLEVDPIHAVVARNLVALAGLTDRIDIWIGHSADLLPRLAERYGGSDDLLPFAFVFMDHKGSLFHEDLASLQQHGLLQGGSVVVADNVLSPGAPLYLWRVAAPSGCGDFRTEVVRLREFSNLKLCSNSNRSLL